MKLKHAKREYFLEDKGCYELHGDKIIAYIITEQGNRINFLFEEGDIVCVPDDGMYVYHKGKESELIYTRTYPRYRDVIKVVRQIELSRLFDINHKVHSALELKESWNLTHKELAAYLGISRESVTRSLLQGEE